MSTESLKGSIGIKKWPLDEKTFKPNIKKTRYIVTNSYLTQINYLMIVEN